MTESNFSVKILAPDRPFYEGPCRALTIPTADGLYGILAHHENMIAAVAPGMLKLRTPEGEEQIAAVSHGMVKVENNRVLLLVDTVERPEEIDANRAKRELDEAREALLQKKSIQDYHAAQARMARAINRLKVKQHQVN